VLTRKYEIHLPSFEGDTGAKMRLDFHTPPPAYSLGEGGHALTEIPKTKPGWALRAYLVLIGYAYRGETITNGELVQAVECESPTALAVC
jgi:hypothetical protein